MPTKIEDLLRQVITEVNRKYELEAFDEGYALGKQEGYEQGYALGFEQEYAKGYALGFEQEYNRGKQENIESIALKMKGKYPPEEISDITGLNLESIEKL